MKNKKKMKAPNEGFCWDYNNTQMTIKNPIDKRLASSSFRSDSYQYRLKKHLIGLVRNLLDLKELLL